MERAGTNADAGGAVRKLARLVLIGLALEVVGWYGAKWYETGTADPRCVFIPGLIANHYRDKTQCEHDPDAE
jgi:hypothetical protein